MHLDMSSYIILREMDRMEGNGFLMGEPEVRSYTCKPFPEISLYLWAPIIPSSTTSFEPPPPTASSCDFSDLGYHVQLPPYAVQPPSSGAQRPALAVRALHLSYDHYSDRCRSSVVPPFPKEFTISLLESVKRETMDSEPKPETVEGTETKGEVSTSPTPSSGDVQPPSTPEGTEAIAVAAPKLEEVDENEVLGYEELLAVCKDERAAILFGGLKRKEVEALNRENGWEKFGRLFMNDRELFAVLGNEILERKKEPGKLFMTKRELKKSIKIPRKSIAFGWQTMEEDSEEEGKIKGEEWDFDPLWGELPGEFEEEGVGEDELKAEDEETPMDKPEDQSSDSSEDSL
ncbi:hypothetical protein J437_LFUL005601, partial [Ladona fulva]